MDYPWILWWGFIATSHLISMLPYTIAAISNIFFFYLLKVENSRHIFSTEWVPSFGTPDLFEVNVACQMSKWEFWHPLLVMSPVILLHKTMMSVSVWLTEVETRFIAAHQKYWTLLFLWGTSWTISEHSFNHTCVCRNSTTLQDISF